MASSSGGLDPQLGVTCREELKSQFSTREGLYRLVSALEISRNIRPAPLPYGGTLNTTANQTPGPSPPFKLTFVRLSEDISPSKSIASDSTTNHNQQDSDTEFDQTDKFVFNFGKELFVYSFVGSRKITDMAKPIDKRVYKGTFPSCHDFNHLTATQDNLSLLIGFSGGQIQLVDPISKEVNKLYNEDRSIDKTRVTCIRWVPNSANLFLVSHGSGHAFLYNAELTSGTTVPHYQTIRQGPGYSVSSVKTKTPRNPITKWVLGEGAIAINEFAFSPCGLYWASVSQDGLLRIFCFETHELEGLTRSYFGGLICVCWSPDSKYVCVGGEDDLVTVWSFKERRVVARGQGHKSWVSVVAFDPYTTTYGDIDGNGETGSTLEASENCHHTTNDSSHVSEISCDCTAANSQISPNNICKSQSSCSGSSSPPVRNDSRRRTSVTMTQNNYLVNSSSEQPIRRTTNRFSRTNSENVNSNMRLSMSEAGTRLPACYRVGSVGQDTQLCLWDLTEDVLKQPYSKPRTVASTSHLNHESISLINHSNKNNSQKAQKNNSGSPPRITSKSIIGNCISSSGSSIVTYSAQHANSNVRQDKETVDAATKDANNVISSVTHKADGAKGSYFSTVSGKKGSITSTTTENGSNSSGHSILSIKFGGLVNLGDKSQKEHKRNFSLGSTTKNNQLTSSSISKTNSGNGSSNSNFAGSTTLSNPSKLIGTEACPRLDECPLLEPLICKKISHERLTALIFREDSIVTACQDGVICTWCRPGEELRISTATTSGGVRCNKIPSVAQDDVFNYNNKDANTTEQL